MSDVELIVKIDEKLYKDIYSDAEIMIYGGMRSGKSLLATLLRAIRNSTPLPKGHGRLIDADAFIAMMEDASKRQKYKELLIGDCLTVDDVFKAVIESLLNKGFAEGDAPTIIEADEVEE